MRIFKFYKLVAQIGKNMAKQNLDKTMRSLYNPKASLLQPIIAIDHFKFIGINLIEILNHVKKEMNSFNVYFKTFTQLTYLI